MSLEGTGGLGTTPWKFSPLWTSPQATCGLARPMARGWGWGQCLSNPSPELQQQFERKRWAHITFTTTECLVWPMHGFTDTWDHLVTPQTKYLFFLPRRAHFPTILNLLFISVITARARGHWRLLTQLLLTCILTLVCTIKHLWPPPLKQHR